MISYLGLLGQFSPAAGRAGRCRQMSLCGGSTRRVLARQLAVLAPSLRVLRAFSLRGERLGRPEVCARSPLVRCAFSLRSERPGQPGVWCPFPWRDAPFPSVASGPGSQRLGALSLRGPSTRRRSGLRKSSDRNRGLFAGWEGVASLGLSLPLSPPPASYLQRRWSGSSLEFLSPFVLRTAGGVFLVVNFSLALPQFKKNLPPGGSQGLLAGPYPKECRRLLSVPPPLAGGGCGPLGYFSAGSCF